MGSKGGAGAAGRQAGLPTSAWLDTEEHASASTTRVTERTQGQGQTGMAM